MLKYIPPGNGKKGGGNKKIQMGSMGIFRDISHRKFFEMDLRGRYSDLLGVMEKSPDGMVIVNRDNEIVYVNASARKLYGKRSEELVGRVFDVKVTGSDQAEIEICNHPDQRKVLGMLSAETVWEGEKCYLVSLRDETENVSMRDVFCEESMRDDLTGLYNRRSFMILANQQMKISKRNKENIYLIFADVDGLKGINDRFGHLSGDRALVEVADSMRSIFRESDLIARICGDEFAAMGTVTGEKDVKTIKGRWKAFLDLKNSCGKAPYRTSVSMGHVCFVPGAGTSMDEMLSKADKKMYKEKKSKGKN